jgi:hypothetical protein
MASSALSYTLRAAARSGQWMTENAVAPIAGISPASRHLADELAPVLDEINRAENAEGRPLLAAVVIIKETGLPGAGFFAYARELGLHTGSDDRAFWESELQRVHDFWYRN